MPVLSEDSVLIMDGAVKLYRRERSRLVHRSPEIYSENETRLLLVIDPVDDADDKEI